MRHAIARARRHACLQLQNVLFNVRLTLYKHLLDVRCIASLNSKSFLILILQKS